MNTHKINILKKRMRNPFLILNFSFLIFSACVRIDVYDTDYPNHGKITLTTDWSQIGQDIVIPQTYIVQVNDYLTTVSGHTNTIDNLFLPGTYNTYIYNVADKITTNGTIATVAVGNNLADPMPDRLFTSTLSVAIEQNKNHLFTAVMQQQVRDLNLVIKTTGDIYDRIEYITATLSGVASSLDFANNTHHDAVNIIPVFMKQADGKWLAAVRLLGITGDEQKLSMTITFADNSPALIIREENIHTRLGDFNADKRTPLTLSAEVIEIPINTGFTSTITDWIDGNNGGETGSAE